MPAVFQHACLLRFYSCFALENKVFTWVQCKKFQVSVVMPSTTRFDGHHHHHLLTSSTVQELCLTSSAWTDPLGLWYSAYAALRAWKMPPQTCWPTPTPSTIGSQLATTRCASFCLLHTSCTMPTTFSSNSHWYMLSVEICIKYTQTQKNAGCSMITKELTMLQGNIAVAHIMSSMIQAWFPLSCHTKFCWC